MFVPYVSLLNVHIRLILAKSVNQASYVNVGRPFRSFVHCFNAGISYLPASSDVQVPFSMLKHSYTVLLIFLISLLPKIFHSGAEKFM